MSDYTKVESAAMSAGIAALKNASASFRSELDTLKRQLDSTLGQWDGAARNAYNDHKQMWDRTADHMEAVIDKMAMVLSSITDGYADNEAAISSSWQ